MPKRFQFRVLMVGVFCAQVKEDFGSFPSETRKFPEKSAFPKFHLTEAAI